MLLVGILAKGKTSRLPFEWINEILHRNIPMKKRATLKDVARKAGVAVSTVSGIINNRSDSWASEATRKRVLDAAEELDFTPNRLARGLRLESFELVLLMVPDLTNPFFANLIRRIRKGLETRGYELIVEETEFEVERERKIIENLPKRMVDGFIGVLSNPPALKASLKRISPRMPMVLIGERMGDLPLDTLESEFQAGFEKAVVHFRELGHRRLGFVDALEGILDPLARLPFYQKVASEHGLTVEDRWVIHCSPDIEDVRHAVVKWCGESAQSDRPTAFFCSNDMTAIATMRGLRDAGLIVPDDISVIGFDNIVLADLLDCPLTTVHQPVRRLAERSCALLLDRIKGEVSGPGAHEILPTRLIVRESTAQAKM